MRNKWKQEDKDTGNKREQTMVCALEQIANSSVSLNPSDSHAENTGFIK